MAIKKSHTDRSIRRKIVDIALETLWPTRCAVCDIASDDVLCDSCKSSLLYIDRLKACPICGAPFGRTQCSECNDVMLAKAGINKVPFEKMSHALLLDEAARSIVAIYKDSGEARLVKHIAKVLERQISPEERNSAYTVTFIPDSPKAARRRGFDHGEEMAREVAYLAKLPLARLLQPPRSADQRQLSSKERITNMTSAMKVRQDTTMPLRVILIDDVCTTGATIYAACAALKDAGVKVIDVITFAQVLD